MMQNKVEIPKPGDELCERPLVYHRRPDGGTCALKKGHKGQHMPKESVDYIRGWFK